MVAKTRTNAGTQTIATGTSTSSNKLGFFQSKEGFCHNSLRIKNHDSEAKEDISISTSYNRDNLQKSSMVIAAIAGQASSRQRNRVLCKCKPTTIDEARKPAPSAKACNKASNQKISKALHNPEVYTKASNKREFPPVQHLL